MRTIERPKTALEWGVDTMAELELFDPVAAIDDAETLERLGTRLDELTATFARFIMVWSIIVNFAWWLTDAFVMGNIPGAVHAFMIMRLCVLGCGLLALVVLRGQRVLVGWRLAVITAIWVVELGALAASLSALGDLSTPWFHCLYPLVISTCVFPFEVGRRAAFASVLAAGLIVGFLIARPSALNSPFLGATIGYLAFTVGVAVAFGHRLHLQTRQTFSQRIALERTAAMLAGQRESLQQQVEHRTAELRMLAEHLDSSAEDERRRIARELHDELGQSVSALRLALSTTRRRYDRDPASISANLDSVGELVARVADGTRETITLLRPRILDDRGLAAAAEWLVTTTAKNSGIACSLTVHGADPSLPSPGDDDDGRRADAVTTAAFRILQESLTNAVKHSRAAHVDVAVRLSNDRIELDVVDDGIGLPSSGTSDGVGLIGIRERARALGGEVHLSSTPGAGTRLRCSLTRKGARRLPTGPEREAA